tara:strand:+ start:970 stop:1224 length:255 start_codon:yes stop_codon:yes gene_type:complete
MGQFFNQPDFGTKAFPVAAGYTTDVSNCALYIGTAPTGGGNLEVTLASSPTVSVTFKNLTSGSFLPCIINTIISGNVTDLVAIQ